uniref:Uncharacterized protein n=1 Tax=Parascaris univalens TaxID=6257 RepID=A0A915A1Z6_PARUN
MITYMKWRGSGMAIMNLLRNEYERIACELGWSIKNFISSLSRPFRHLDTSASTLNELQRSASRSWRYTAGSLLVSRYFGALSFLCQQWLYWRDSYV